MQFLEDGVQTVGMFCHKFTGARHLAEKHFAEKAFHQNNTLPNILL